MIVVLDTNIWMKELALNSGVGSALRFFLKQRQARLAVPEVIRLEVQHNLRALIAEAVEQVDRGNRQLLALFGSMKEIVLPGPAEIDSIVSGSFTSLGIDILEIPFSFESALASFMKTIQKLPPSDKTQEFKDGVLWADCTRLLEQDDVLLATQDKAFYADREFGRGLAKNLLAESKTKRGQLTLAHSITDVLAHVGTKIEIDKDWFASIVRRRAHTAAEGLLSRSEAEVSGESSVRLELFVTERPELLYFTHRIEIPCSDLSANGRTKMVLVLGGNGTLRPQPPEIVDVRTEEETLKFANPDGSDGQLRNIYGVASGGVFGHRTITHTVRHPLHGHPG